MKTTLLIVMLQEKDTLPYARNIQSIAVYQKGFHVTRSFSCQKKTSEEYQEC